LTDLVIVFLQPLFFIIVMIVDKEIVKQHRVPFTFFLAQLVLAFLVVYQFLIIIGFSFNVANRSLSFGLSLNPLDYFFLFFSLALLYALYAVSKKKYEEVFVATSLLPFQLKSTTKFKLWLAKAG